MNKKHNGIISFWKFIFSIVILLFHFFQKHNSNYFLTGYLGVEFFFLVSGYFMAHDALKNCDTNENRIGYMTWQYIYCKVKYLFPYVLIAFFISMLLKSTYRSFHIFQYIRSIWNLLLIDMSGIITTQMSALTWYISAMLISMLVLYPLILKYKKNFIYICSPLIVLFVGGYYSHTYGDLSRVLSWNGFAYAGLFRAFFEISLGTIIYLIVSKIKQIDFTKFGKFCFTLLELLCFIFVLIICVGFKNYDFVVLFALAIAIIMALSEKTLLFHFANNKVFYFLEKLSLPIYLNHSWIEDVVIRIAPNIGIVNQFFCVLIFTFLISVFMIWIIPKLVYFTINLCKKIFLVESL